MQLRLRLRPVGRFWAKTNNSEAQRAAILEEQRDRHKLLVREALSYLLVAICEDLPMVTLTVVPTSRDLRDPPLPHRRRDWAHPCRIRTGTALTPSHVCIGTGRLMPHLDARLGSPLPRRVPHRRRDWAHPVPKVSAAPVRA